MIIDNNNDVYLWPFRVGISVLVTGGVGHQPHHDALAVLPRGLVLIVQVSKAVSLSSRHCSCSLTLARLHWWGLIWLKRWKFLPGRTLRPPRDTLQLWSGLRSRNCRLLLLCWLQMWLTLTLSGDCCSLRTLVINLSLVLSWPEAVMV